VHGHALHAQRVGHFDTGFSAGIKTVQSTLALELPRPLQAKGSRR
jgi:hypothetical protein